jgi:hypothetical protein
MCMRIYVFVYECMYVRMCAYVHVCFWCCDILTQNLVVSVTNFCFNICLNIFFWNKSQNDLQTWLHFTTIIVNVDLHMELNQRHYWANYSFS